MDISKLNGQLANCPCGKTHYFESDFIEIGHNVLENIYSLCHKYSKILVVSDENTYNVCGSKVVTLLSDKVKKSLILSDNGPVIVPNEEKIEEINSAFTSDDCFDLIVGVGSGVINDLCKYVSYNHGLPYYIVATAPSMDGYTSVGCALILGGMKVTKNALPPKGIIGDTTILKDAPMEMLRAGYGDIIGKFSCLNDWKLSSLINGEYFCQNVYDITYSCAEQVSKLAKGIVDREEETIKTLMEALVLVGIAMSYVGNSRPASGSEHHLSHFFEIVGLLEGKEYFLHGIDVAYSSVCTQMLREEILEMDKPDKRVGFNEEKYKETIKKIYHSAGDGVIALQQKLGWYNQDKLSTYQEKWTEIKEILASAPTSEQFIDYLNNIGLDFEEFKSHYGEKMINDAVWFAKDLKDRYTILWLYFDLKYQF